TRDRRRHESQDARARHHLAAVYSIAMVAAAERPERTCRLESIAGLLPFAAVDSLQRRDLAVMWHPATHFDDLAVAPPLPIRGASARWLETTAGRRILDAIASWWTSVHGHRHPAIVAAIRAQLDTLDHVMFAGFTHEPAVRLAEALLAIAPAF